MENVKKILESYRWANVEVERMERRRRRLEKRGQDLTADTVLGSMEEYPYIERVVKIQGVQDSNLAELQQQIDEAIDRGLRIRHETEEIIASAEDAQTREVLRSRYIDCLSWEAVGRKNHMSERQARRIVNGFVEKISRF